MTNISLKNEILGNIESIRITTENYPIMLSSNSIGSMVQNNRASFDFTIDIMKLLGIDPNSVLEKILEKFDKSSDNFLTAMENAFKIALIANLKGLLSCTVDPFLPDNLFDSYSIIGAGTNGEPIIGSGEGIVLNIGDFDMLNTLKISPLDDKLGKLYYFDNNYGQKDLYKSKDFNTFLWYIVNKGINTNNIDKSKLIWNNRNGYNYTVNGIYNSKKEAEENIKNILEDTIIYITDIEKYFKIVKDDGGKKLLECPDYKNIILCEFLERDFPNSNVLKIKISSSTYGKNKNGKKSNSTIMEFNSDFINSFTIFDKETFLGRIVAEMTNSLPIELNLTIDNIINRDKINYYVNRILENEETTISDCFYTFSNNEYEDLIDKAEKKYAGLIEQGNDTYVEYDEEALKNITKIRDENSTLQENQMTINKTFSQIEARTNKNNEQTTFTFSVWETINKLFTSIGVIVMESILSPKIQILLAINKYVSGGYDAYLTPDEWLKNNLSILDSCIREVFNIVDDLLIEMIMKELSPYIDTYGKLIDTEMINITNNLINTYLNYTSSNTVDVPIKNNTNREFVTPTEKC